ncbi:uncharacterized protein LOC135931069 [Gordionus sp. m RMFG-2023]|uniref:uncharacterized protein LOC135931069 n=1 Tax=Gordionus sp. m RMFG-2023 TaxID=3053472 RepID=UPI0031FE2BBC
MIPTSYRKSKYYKCIIYYICTSPTCHGRGFTLNNVFILTAECNDICNYLRARRGISLGRNEDNVTSVNIHKQEDGSAVRISGILEEGPESIYSMINPIREDADFESMGRNEEIVTSVINHEQEDGGAVGISGILEEGPESISSMINPIREDADFESMRRNEEIVTSVINHEQEDGGAVGISGIPEEGPESISSMINPIREDADFKSMGRNEKIVTSVINHEQEDGGAVGISGIPEEGPESISSMINPIREDADFESMGRNKEIVTSVINHEQEDGEDDLHVLPYLDESFIDEDVVIDISIAADSSVTLPISVNNIQFSYLNVEQPYNFILSHKKRNLLYSNKFLYVHHKFGILFKCRLSHCTARGTLLNMQFTLTHIHNHPSESEEEHYAILVTMNKLKEQIRAYPYQSKRKTYNQVMHIRKMDPLLTLF